MISKLTNNNAVLRNDSVDFAASFFFLSHRFFFMNLHNMARTQVLQDQAISQSDCRQRLRLVKNFLREQSVKEVQWFCLPAGLRRLGDVEIVHVRKWLFLLLSFGHSCLVGFDCFLLRRNFLGGGDRWVDSDGFLRVAFHLDLLNSQLSAILKVKPELRITSLLIGYQSVFSVIFLS